MRTYTDAEVRVVAAALDAAEENYADSVGRAAYMLAELLHAGLELQPITKGTLKSALRAYRGLT